MKRIALIALVPALLAQALPERGQHRLNAIVHRGIRLLRAREVRSLAYPEQLVADLFPPDHYQAIVVAEQSGRPGLAAVASVLEVFSKFGRRAFSQSASSCGARAAAQILPRTYTHLRETYPNARLPGFVSCQRDVSCQVVAMGCYFDLSLAALSDSERTRLESRPVERSLFLGAAYNCGPDCAVSALRTHPINWMNGAGLPYETQRYLPKVLHALAILSAANHRQL